MIENLPELKKYSYSLRFETSNGKLIVEIQYFIDLEYGKKFDNKFIHFAVTTDGWDLLIDTNLGSESIMQKENDDIDYLGITLTDLLKAKTVPLCSE